MRDSNIQTLPVLLLVCALSLQTSGAGQDVKMAGRCVVQTERESSSSRTDWPVSGETSPPSGEKQGQVSRCE